MEILIGENLRHMRKQRNLMQEQLAEALGVSIGAVSKWERGAAVPDLRYIVEMADLFGVSVDALVGYQVQDGAAKALEEQIHGLQRKKDYETAAAEAEKALARYPNNFAVVYRCGEMYQLNGMENRDGRAAGRAVELLKHAMLLLPQNTNPEISELSIQRMIANCLLIQDKKEEALNLLKAYNAGGVNNAQIGFVCAASEDLDPGEAAPYLMGAFFDVFADLVRIMTGYVNYYVRQGEYENALDAALWLIRYLESLRSRKDSVTYADKICAAFYSECAHLSDLLNRPEDTEPYLRRAYQLARDFDRTPVYQVCQMKFSIGNLENAVAYDDIGLTAMDAISRQIEGEDWNDRLRSLWRDIQAEP